MPWQARSPMDERVQFITDYQRQLFTMTDAVRAVRHQSKDRIQVGRRYDAEGAAGLGARSSRPRPQPQATAARVVDAIVALRTRTRPGAGKNSSSCCRNTTDRGRCRPSARRMIF